MSRSRFLAVILSVAATTVATLVAPGSAAVAAPAAAGAPVAAPPGAIPEAPANGFRLGPNVYVFTPQMPQRQIQQAVDAIADQQVSNQFGPQRYALLFAPGTYGSAANPLQFQVGYYTEVAGLGRSPHDVTINGTIDVYNQCFANPDGSPNCIALDNFWRSLSNLTINVTGQTGCRSGTDFWATSQAASLRRVDLTGGNLSLMDYCTAGPQYASGGFIADSAFSGGTVINGSQQQFLVRDSSLDGWSNGVWNQVFAGVDGAPSQSFGQPGAQPYTTLPTTALTREAPYLYAEAGRLSVFVPAPRRDASGVSWSAEATPGRSLSLGGFFVANPQTPLWRINLALLTGANLLLTPGVYRLTGPITVLRPDTVVLGLGFATLVPTAGTPAMVVATSRGVQLSGLIFDAGPRRSNTLLQFGMCARCGASAADPATMSDVFFRIGGATAGTARTALVVDAAHVILDNIWAWRADHGTGVGWTANTSDTGLVVNGADVAAYGLFVEHFQKQNVIWNGERGRVVFFQNELPYDVPAQSAWSAGRSVLGYPAFEISNRVRTFTGYGMGSYCFFNQGLDIHASAAFRVPRTAGVQLHDLLTVFLNGSGGIDSVVDGVGAPVSAANSGQASMVVSFPAP
jgi:hypothetical protein